MLLNVKLVPAIIPNKLQWGQFVHNRLISITGTNFNISTKPCPYYNHSLLGMSVANLFTADLIGFTGIYLN